MRTFRIRLVWFTLAVCALCLIAAELAANLFWPTPPGLANFHDLIFEHDPELGWTIKPNLHLVEHFQDGHETLVKTNSKGFRDIEHGPPAEEPRIVVLGDSFTFGTGVNNDEVFAARLKELIPEAEVINLGVPAYGLSQERRMLARNGLAYGPAVVLLALCQNDIDDIDDIDPPPVVAPEPKPGFFSALKRVLENNLRLSTLAEGAVRGNRPLADFLVSIGLKKPLGGYEELDPSLRPAIVEEPERLQSKWRVAIEELQAIQQLAESIGARLIVAPIPARQAIEPDALQASLATVTFRPADFDLAKPYSELCRKLSAAGIACASPYPEFLEHAGERLYIRYDMHFSVAGHRLFAKVVAPKVREMLKLADRKT